LIVVYVLIYISVSSAPLPGTAAVDDEWTTVAAKPRKQRVTPPPSPPLAPIVSSTSMASTSGELDDGTAGQTDNTGSEPPSALSALNTSNATAEISPAPTDAKAAVAEISSAPTNDEGAALRAQAERGAAVRRLAAEQLDVADALRAFVDWELLTGADMYDSGFMLYILCCL
jgi:hypothetical protein